MNAFRLGLLSLCVGCVVPTAALAFQNDEKKTEAPATEQPKADDQNPAEAKDPIAEWKELDAKKTEVAERLQKLQQDFQSADREGKLKIRTEFQTAIADFQENILPRMSELAPKVFELDPQQFDAGELVMQTALRENRYADALAVADKLAAAEHSTPSVRYVLASANFALHNFEKSTEILKTAQKDGLLDPDGEQMLKASEEYVEFWKKEQEIRAAEDKADAEHQNPRVELKTSRGNVVVELFEDQAPNTVANFVSLVESKYYDGTKFHRVEPNFVIQGGDPNSKDADPTNDGQGGPGYTIDCECYRDDARKHFQGSLSMAHAGKDTGGSQFFITQQPTPHLNPVPNPEHVHTVFGRVIEGMDVVAAVQPDDTVDSATVLRKRNHEYKPETHKEEAKPAPEK